MKFLVSVVLSALILAIDGRLFINRTCSSYNATQMHNFQINRFVGKWYEIAKYENQTSTGHPSNGCSFHNISYNPSTHQSTVTTYTKTSFSNVHISNGTINSILGGISWISNAKNEDSIFVLGTDYNQYAILWYCKDHPFGVSSQNVTILSKQLTSPSMLPQVGDILKNSGIENDSIPLTIINQSECYKIAFGNGTGGNGSVGGGGFSPGYGRPGYNAATTKNLNLVTVFVLIFTAIVANT